ncbi:DNA-3-methyladenine glycosylase I [Agromyces rhizosphaerae]|uniref:DNA-3-methyladenine glycosylase I n=1 Tax=Agromyces rhizosphaerae TaxID=88374 RepID=A0A9W6CT94_9MICO|nr:DNA-3-methyladenine glycosylase I [Agromyces rhizosphaerae]
MSQADAAAAPRDGVLVDAHGVARCAWSGTDPEYRRYHDEEWGVPQRDPRALYEKLCLEGFQAGLSWLTILRRRDRFREAFHGFAPDRVAAMGADDVERLMQDAGIIRNRAKIEATIGNALAMLDLDEPLDELMWGFAPAPGPRPARMDALPATTPESAGLSRELRRRGFRFVGPTTVYALMQSTGMVDDHMVGCHRAGGSDDQFDLRDPAGPDALRAREAMAVRVAPIDER